MKTEDAGDYGGTCDTCSHGMAKAGHRQCLACERRDAEMDAQYAEADLRTKMAELTEASDEEEE